MSQIVFLPGFDGNAELRRDFTAALGKRHEVRAVSYPNRTLGSLDAYRVQAMGEAPVDWRPVLVAESFSGLVATGWASVDASTCSCCSTFGGGLQPKVASALAELYAARSDPKVRQTCRELIRQYAGTEAVEALPD